MQSTFYQALETRTGGNGVLRGAASGAKNFLVGKIWGSSDEAAVPIKTDAAVSAAAN